MNSQSFPIWPISIQKVCNRLDKKSFFGKTKPDFDEALSQFEAAANLFKSLKEYELAASSLEKAADCHRNLDSLYMAAKSLESSAQLTLEFLKKPAQAAELFKKTSDYYLAHGTSDRAAEALEKAAKALEQVSVEKALEAYAETLSLIESEDRPRAGVDVFKRAIALAVRASTTNQNSIHLTTAQEFTKRIIELLIKLDQKPFVYKQVLSSVLISLAQKNEGKAAEVLHCYSGSVHGMSSSSEGSVAQELLDAFAQGDQETVDKLAKSTTVRYLDNEVGSNLILTELTPKPF
jgi:tetratricopeptide (TPR) repeat protein